ncbi:hypothetical protein ACH5RR_024739 [Cinchona calisaya]|uniref:RBR-type E3 ubiquitin transferase n=1 Tax=Cinchona calisaya TaxID=153742 RepID=A0ABD2YXN0_9GENT
MAQEPALDLSCDEFYLSALLSEADELDHHDDQIFPISDVKYAQGLQFQEAVVASMMPETSPQSSQIHVAASSSRAQESQSCLVQPEEEEEGKVEQGESSLNFCEICVERKESDEMFTIQCCTHLFCNDCISKHVAARLQYNTHSIACPAVKCEGVIEFDSCMSIMPKDVLERWNEVLCESIILVSQKFYCPFKDCSAMLVRESDEVIRESECPVCFRLFCAQCYVPWHPGADCEEFQRLNEDEKSREDLMLRELAKAKSWNRCPRCKYYVEKTQGCIHMTCRCGFQFCYACGETWTSTHGGCQ